MPSILKEISDLNASDERPELLAGAPGLDISRWASTINRACDAFFKRRGIETLTFREVQSASFKGSKARKRRLEQEVEKYD
jgi:hypothetical protein